jgi:hypothetical protein
LGAAALTATEASAMLKDPGPGAMSTAGDASNCPEEGRGYPPGWWVGYPGTEATGPEYNYPNYDPQHEVAPVAAAMAPSPSDDNAAEALQAGASALGGAGLAFGGLWLYRRRHAPAV